MALTKVKFCRLVLPVARSWFVWRVVPSQVKVEAEERLEELVQKATSVLLPEPVRDEPPMQAPRMAKQPLVRSRPLAKVEEAVVEVRLR